MSSLYFGRKKGDLQKQIEKCERFDKKTLEKYEMLAKERIEKEYNWPKVVESYKKIW